MKFKINTIIFIIGLLSFFEIPFFHYTFEYGSKIYAVLQIIIGVFCFVKLIKSKQLSKINYVIWSFCIVLFIVIPPRSMFLAIPLFDIPAILYVDEAYVT